MLEAVVLGRQALEESKVDGWEMGEYRGTTIRVESRVQNMAGWECMRLWEIVERGIGKGKARGTEKGISANGVIGNGIANVNSSVSEKIT